jgi:hypothetical protein
MGAISTVGKASCGATARDGRKTGLYRRRRPAEIDQPWCLLKSLFALGERLNNLLRPASGRIAQLA